MACGVSRQGFSAIAQSLSSGLELSSSRVRFLRRSVPELVRVVGVVGMVYLRLLSRTPSGAVEGETLFAGLISSFLETFCFVLFCSVFLFCLVCGICGWICSYVSDLDGIH
jgi:hypothetical protein